MKRLFISFLIILILLSCDKEQKLDDQTIAIVDKYKISFSDYKKRYAEYLSISLMKDNYVTRRQIAQNMINELLLEKFDDNSNLEKNIDFQIELNWTKNQMILGFLKDREVYAKIEATEEEIRQAYKRSNEKLAARHLYASTEEDALKLHNALQKGASFESLANDVFTDSTLKNNGGFLGYFSWGDMDPAFENAAYKMGAGEISKPVKTAQGYSIIKVEDRINAPLLTETEYQKNKRKFERLVKISKKKIAEEEYISKHFDHSKLLFFEDGLKTLVERLSNVSDDESSLYEKVAKYADREFNVEQLHYQIDQIPDYLKSNLKDYNSLKLVITGLLIQEQLFEAAKDLGYDRQVEVEKAIEQSKSNLFIKYKRKKILNNTSIDDSILRAYYTKNISDFVSPKKINVSEILVGNKTLALKIKGQLLSGKDFAKLAKEHSLRKWSANRGGTLGMSDLDQFGSFKNKFWNAPINKIIGPYEIEGFYGVFKVTEKVDEQPIEYDEIDDRVREQYKKDYETKIVFNYFVGLNKSVNIQINEELIKWFALDDPIVN